MLEVANPRRYLALFCLVLVLFQSGGYYVVIDLLKIQLSERTAGEIATEKAPLGEQLVFRIHIAPESLMLGDYAVTVQ